MADGRELIRDPAMHLQLMRLDLEVGDRLGGEQSLGGRTNGDWAIESSRTLRPEHSIFGKKAGELLRIALFMGIPEGGSLGSNRRNRVSGGVLHCRAGSHDEQADDQRK
jgi:hypothetical protein